MSSFCEECRKKCGYSSDSDTDANSDTSSEYYQDTSDDLPIDLTSLNISEPTDSDLPIDLSSLSITDTSTTQTEPTTTEQTSTEPTSTEQTSTEQTSTEQTSTEQTSTEPVTYEESESEDTTESSEDRKRKRSSSPEVELDFSKLRLQDNADDDKLSNLLSSLFVSDKVKSEEPKDELDMLSSVLSRKLKISPKKRRTDIYTPMDVEDVPLKQRLRKSIKKPIKGKMSSKEVPREKWSIHDDTEDLFDNFFDKKGKLKKK